MRPGGFFGALHTGKRNESPAICVREVFALRRTVPRSKKGTCPKQMPPYMVRVTGLEARACGAGFARCAIVWQVQVLWAGGVPRSKKGTCPKQMPPYMVRVTGLEPARQRHQNLNLARLPFRHTRMDRYLFSIPAPR